MPEGGSNEALLALQKYREYVAGRRGAVAAMWKNPPPPVMLAYGAVVVTSGVLFSALGHWNKIKGFVWGSGLAVILDLALASGSVIVPAGGKVKLGEVLVDVMARVGLPETTKDELAGLFLELVQWELIAAVNEELSEATREQLAAILRSEGSEDEQSRAILGFLQGVGVDPYRAKKFLDRSVGAAVAGMAKVFEKRGYGVGGLMTGMFK